jgi:hypothetical protein
MKELDRWAKLNVEMDQRAKNYIAVVKRSPRHCKISQEPWSLWFNKTKIVSDPANSIYDLVHSDEAKTYWGKKDGVTRYAL